MVIKRKNIKLKMISFRKKKIIRKKNCVLCNSKNLKEVLDFGKTPLANSYPKTVNEKRKVFLI